MDDSGWRREQPVSPDQLLPRKPPRPPETPAEAAARRAQGRERGKAIYAAWRAAGSPKDPERQWNNAIRNFTVPDSERFNVYVWPERVAEHLSNDEASALLQRLRRSKEYHNRSVNDFAVWPVNAEPIPEDWAERQTANLRWLRSLGLTTPHPDEDTPERQAWITWRQDRAGLRFHLSVD